MCKLLDIPRSSLYYNHNKNYELSAGEKVKKLIIIGKVDQKLLDLLQN